MENDTRRLKIYHNDKLIWETAFISNGNQAINDFVKNIDDVFKKCGFVEKSNFPETNFWDNDAKTSFVRMTTHYDTKFGEVIYIDETENKQLTIEEHTVNLLFCVNSLKKAFDDSFVLTL